MKKYFLLLFAAGAFFLSARYSAPDTRMNTAVFTAGGANARATLYHRPENLYSGKNTPGAAKYAGGTAPAPVREFYYSRNLPPAILTRMEEMAGGLHLDKVKEKICLDRVDVAVLKKKPGDCLWENVERIRLTALVKDDVFFISTDQLSRIYPVSFHPELRRGSLTVSLFLSNRLTSFSEGTKKAVVGGIGAQLSGSPFRLPEDHRFWLPLKDWAGIAGAELLPTGQPHTPLLINLSSVNAAGREELRPGWTVSGRARMYGHRDLKRDLKVFAGLFPGARIETIGRSALGRDIPVAVLGKGPAKIFINGAWHGDEHITAAFLTRFVEEVCRNSGEPHWKSLLEKVTLYIAPMINPDGCEIAAHSDNLPPDLANVAAALSPPGFELRHWRANSQGIDLNSQYPARWEAARNRHQHNVFPRGIAGHRPLSAPESRAAYDFTLRHDFKAVFCYHSQGEVLFWQPLEGDTTQAMQDITAIYAAASGYTPVDTPDLSGGYRDWFVTTYRRPGLTVEVGRGSNPLPLQQFEDIWIRNSRALFMCLQALAD